MVEKSNTRIQSLWNPFRDWKARRSSKESWRDGGFKASETLLGIENLKYGLQR